jgi:predicted XRE-type DNA-binding protein
MVKDALRFEESSNNIFADIGVRDPEDSLLRAQLVLQLARVIRKKSLSQTEIAKILGVDQSKVSKLVRGRISGFTSDRLLRFLVALGCDVKIEVRQKNRGQKRGRLVVRAA